MKLAALLLLLFTLAMVGVHLTSAQLLRRIWTKRAPHWLSALTIFRFEGIYYVLLMGYVVWQRGRFLLTPLLIMAVLHIGGWMMAEGRRAWLVNAGGEAARTRILAAVQAFDLAETVVLVYIGWVFARAIFAA